jgi:hypothetical protein
MNDVIVNPTVTMASECAVCYSSNSNCKLVCGHSFCFSCVKKWYNKGADQNCPMCRAPIYFKGLYKKQEEWANEAYETKAAEVFSEYFESTLETGIEDSKDFVEIFKKSHRPSIRAACMKEVMGDLKNLERTHRYLLHEQVGQEDIDDVHYYGDYYSDRTLSAKNEFRERPRPPPPPRHAGRRNSHKVMLHARGHC